MMTPAAHAPPGGSPTLRPLAALFVLLLAASGAATSADVAALTVSPNVRATTTAGPASEVSLAVDPTDPLHIVATAKDYGLTGVTAHRCSVHRVWGGLYVSFDGGATWANGYFPGGYPGEEGAAAGFACMSDPVVVFDAHGTAHFTGLVELRTIAGVECPLPPIFGGATCLTEWGLVYAKSQDGIEWTDQTLVWRGTGGLGGAGDSWSDKQWHAIDPSDTSRVYIAWDLVAGFGVKPMLSRSTDGGATWVTTPLPQLGGLPGIAVGPDGALYVALVGECVERHTPPSLNCISLLRSTDGGATFLLSDAGVRHGGATSLPYRSPQIPVVAVEPSTNTVLVAWHDFAQVGQRLRIVVARSTDGGATFAQSVLADRASAHQLMPAIAAGGDGLVGVLYYEDDATGSHNMRARFALSRDAGAAWGAPVSASSASFQPWAAFHQDGFTFMGDYLGLGSAMDGAFHAAWADTRLGRADVFATRITT